MKKYVYLFSEGNKDMRNLLGGKGANLAEMTGIGLPVPQGFTVTTEACTQYYEDGKMISDDIKGQIVEHVKKLEEITGRTLGDPKNPLLVSVRSGARISMPGMMDTVLNLGLNDEVAKEFAATTGNERFVYDSYRRFIQMFADVVKGFPKSDFEHKFDAIKEEKGVEFDTELTAEDLKEVVAVYKEAYKAHAGVDFPQEPLEQLLAAVEAVFGSWNNDRAITYRRLNDIPGSWGTAVNVQQMVYGNRSDKSGTGVAFTRNPATGENKLFGEYLMNAQGEDVVAGIRTPQPIATLNEVMPECYEQFQKICHILEDHYKDMQDMEFTIEDGKLFMLQTRNGKRTAQAALKIACDLVDEGMRTEEEAVAMIDPRNLDTLLHPQFDAAALKAATPGTKKALHEAISKLKVKPDRILVDALEHIDTNGIPYTSIIKGDAKVYSISAASIIAKVTRDRMMQEYDEIYPEYGFAKHKGYGTAQHIQAIKTYGPCLLHRKSFIKNFI